MKWFTLAVMLVAVLSAIINLIQGNTHDALLWLAFAQVCLINVKLDEMRG